MSTTGTAGTHERRLHTLSLVSWDEKRYDIRDQYIALTYSESITSSYCSGDLILLDAVDFPTLLPMIGEERVQAKFSKIDFNDPLGVNEFLPISFDMSVYRMDGKSIAGGSRKKQLYKIFFASRSAFINHDKVIYASYKSMRYSDMVKKIYEDYIKEDGPNYKPLIIEETKYTADFYVQGLSPTKAIQEICKRSVSAEDNGSVYIFYEDRDAYNFVTIQKLLKKESKITLSCELKNILKDGSVHRELDLERQSLNADVYSQQASFDIFQSIKSGEGTSSLLAIDPTLRKFYYEEFDLRENDNAGQENWSKYSKISTKKPWTKNNKMFVNPRANLSVLITDVEWSTDDIIAKKSSESPSDSRKDIYLERMSMLKQIQKTVLNVTVAGHPNIKAGDIITFKVPENSGASLSGQKPEEEDKWISGKFLVWAVSHVIENDEYLMGLKLIKDGFETDIFHRDPTEYGE